MIRALSPVLLRLAALAAAAALTGCPSPVQDDLIAELGSEPGEPSELHRPGQPCLACHGEYVGEEPILVVAGTVYATPVDAVAAPGVRVELTDATGSKIEKTTNEAGNFLVEQGEWEPVFPLRAVVECTMPDGRVRRNVMGTRIERDGSCAGCHADEAPSQLGPGRVFCTDEVPGAAGSTGGQP
jgi:hypothetical protein